MRRRAFIGSVAAAIGGGTCWVCMRGDDGPLPDRVSLSVELSMEALPADAMSEPWAILRVATLPAETSSRPPINVGLVIDTSSSMEGAPIEAARRAAADLIETLRDGDRLVVVAFHSRAELVVEAVEIDGGRRADALERVRGMQARGTTDLAQGLHTAIEALEPHTAGGRVTRIVLLGDGIPNDASTVDYAATRAAGLGITISSLGFGLDYDEVLLESIARRTGGSFAYLDDPDEIGPTFTAETRRLQGILAKDMQLSLVAGPRCRFSQIDGQVVGAGTRAWSLALGDLAEGEERVIAVRLEVDGHRAGSTAELMDATLTYVDPGSGEAAEPRFVFASAPVSDDGSRLAQATRPDVEREVQRARAAAATLQALEATRVGEYRNGKAILTAALPAVAESAERLEDPQLASQVEDMEALVEDLTRQADEPHPAPLKMPAGAAAVAPRSKVSKGKNARRAHANALQNFQARVAEE